MKAEILVLTMAVLFSGMGAAGGSWPPWTGDETYTFDDTDPYFTEGTITDTATVNITGGSFGALLCGLDSTVNMSSGIGGSIGAFDASVVNLSGGQLQFLGATDFTQIHMFVLDYGIMNRNRDYLPDFLTMVVSKELT